VALALTSVGLAWAEAAPSASASASAAPASAAPASASAAPAVRVPVKFQDTTVFVVRAPSGDLSPEQRAEAASSALKEALKSSTADDVRVETKGDFAVVYAGTTPIISVTREDAALAGDASKEDHAAALATSIRQVMRSEQKRSAISRTVFSLSMVVLFGLMALYLLRKIGQLSNRARTWLANNPERVPAIRVYSLEVLKPSVLRSTLDITLMVGRWLAQIGLIYAWLVAVLSLFESTRGYTQRLTGFVFAPLSKVAERLAGSLPLALIALFAAVLVFVLVRVAGAFFDSVSKEHTRLTWLPRELARPTGLLVRVGIVTLSLVFAAPLITGDPDGALAKLGTVTLIVFGLSATPLVACALVGSSVVYLRRVHAGEFVEFGGRVGRVLDIGLLELRLIDEDGCEVRVPYLLSLVHPTRIVGHAPRVSMEINVLASVPHQQLREQLIEAATSVGEAASATVIALDDDTLRWRVSVSSTDADAKTLLYTVILDALARAKVKLVRRVRADAA
jgi:small-conductance mechanosensitive channel